MIVFGSSKEMFNEKEIKALQEFIEFGGKILVLSSEGGEQKNNTNINVFLE